MQRRIEPRSADDSLSGVVRCLYFADTFLRDGEPGRDGLETKRPQLAIQETAVGRGLDGITGASRRHRRRGAGQPHSSPGIPAGRGEGSHRSSD